MFTRVEMGGEDVGVGVGGGGEAADTWAVLEEGGRGRGGGRGKEGVTDTSAMLEEGVGRQWGGRHLGSISTSQTIPLQTPGLLNPHTKCSERLPAHTTAS